MKMKIKMILTITFIKLRHTMRYAWLDHVTNGGKSEGRESQGIVSNHAKHFELLNRRDSMKWDRKYLNVTGNRNTTGYCGDL